MKIIARLMPVLSIDLKSPEIPEMLLVARCTRVESYEFQLLHS